MSKNKVVVMMATYNGLNWIDEQIESILRQRDVDVNLLISDDNSKDGTYEWLSQRALKDKRITLLPREHTEQLGPGGNFYHLLRHVDVQSDCYYAFSDQDDVWFENKLSNQTAMLSQHGVSAVSSDVEGFWLDGTRRLIKKSQPQRQFDYFFESAGPGCSFCFDKNVLLLVKYFLEKYQDHQLPKLHDWCVYALCRSHNLPWLIDSTPTLAYRQHHHNEVGAHLGWSAMFQRLRVVMNGEFRHEVTKIAQILSDQDDNACRELSQRLLRMNIRDRLFLLRHCREFRRQRLDSTALAFMFASAIY